MKKTKWIIDPIHSELGFKIKHLMITNVPGSFKKFEGEVETEGEDFNTAAIRLKADMDSISTNNEQRDAHLRSAEFFDVEQYPDLNFESTRIDKEDAEHFILHGNLTIKGITHPVRLNLEYNGISQDPWGGERAGFSVRGQIRRTDFGMHFNSVLDTGGIGLSEEVKINAEMQLVKQQAEVLV